jgi:hypothetical protein
MAISAHACSFNSHRSPSSTSCTPACPAPHPTVAACSVNGVPLFLNLPYTCSFGLSLDDIVNQSRPTSSQINILLCGAPAHLLPTQAPPPTPPTLTPVAAESRFPPHLAAFSPRAPSSLSSVHVYGDLDSIRPVGSTGRGEGGGATRRAGWEGGEEGRGSTGLGGRPHPLTWLGTSALSGRWVGGE